MGGGGLCFAISRLVHHPLGIQNPLETIDLTDPGGAEPPSLIFILLDGCGLSKDRLLLRWKRNMNLSRKVQSRVYIYPHSLTNTNSVWILETAPGFTEGRVNQSRKWILYHKL